ncbi:MAG TPA: DoxX family protein, partial [Gemmatimonadales bacterium]|nr:DoxX family protein [Gemmatimonadales bacterium]
GALGLILPGALRIKRGLTPLAAAGLVIIMIGAVITTVATQGVAPAVMPFVVGILAGVVVRGRRDWATPAVVSQAQARPLARAA